MKKKCICKNCEDCKMFLHWNLVDDKGHQKIEQKCGFQVLFEEIPRIRGAIDGLQGGVNEARNRSIEARVATENLTATFATIVGKIANNNLKLVEGGK